MTGSVAYDVEPAAPRLLHRAWLTVAAGLAIFSIVAVIAGLAANWVIQHATVDRSGQATVISGSEALWRSSPDREWSIFNESIVIEEGDEISTELGTVVWVTLFDGSTLEITERSHVRFDRLRESRFSKSTRQASMMLQRGTIYGTMAPVIDREYGELEIVTPDARLMAREERDRRASVSTAFLVEVRDVDLAGLTRFRAAAFRGEIDINRNGVAIQLEGPEQYEIDHAGVGRTTTSIRSEVLANGTFVDELAGWEPVYSAEAREPMNRIGVVETTTSPQLQDTPALHIHREVSDVWARTGVRQEIHRTLRLPSALTLTFDIMVANQGEALNGRETVPLAIELNYTDILGQERSWTTVYATREPDGVLDADSFTTVRIGEWTHVIVDLHNLEPIPKVLETLVVYASGGGYDSFVANLSLTTGEGITSP